MSGSVEKARLLCEACLLRREVIRGAVTSTEGQLMHTELAKELKEMCMDIQRCSICHEMNE